VPTWQANTSYKVGDRVYRNGTNLIYECTTDHTSASVLNSDYWKRIMTLNYVEIVGNGTATDARSNARTLDWAGNEWLAGNLTAAGGTFTLGATALTEAQL
jgi:chitodextrinase